MPTLRSHTLLQAETQAKGCFGSTAQKNCKLDTTDPRKTAVLLVTSAWQKMQYSATQTHLLLIEAWFSGSIFVLKIASLAKLETDLAFVKPKHQT